MTATREYPTLAFAQPTLPFEPDPQPVWTAPLVVWRRTRPTVRVVVKGNVL